MARAQSHWHAVCVLRIHDVDWEVLIRIKKDEWTYSMAIPTAVLHH